MPLGPFSIPAGQTAGSGPGSQPPVSGRISSLALDPKDPEHLLIGAAAGGIWETIDGGVHWASGTDDQRTLAIGAVAFHPDDPRIVYSGTGEGNTVTSGPGEGNFSDLGTGVLKSSDGGTHWEELPERRFDGAGFFDLLVFGDRLLAATTRELCLSTDCGKSWHHVRNLRTWSLSRHSQSGEILAGCEDGLQRSINDGEDWFPVNLPGAPTPLNRMAVCHSATRGDLAYVFAAGFGDNRPYLWRRDPMDSPTGFSIVPLLPSIDSGRADHHWLAGLLPSEPDSAETLFLGSVSLFRGIRLKNGAWRWSNVASRNEGDSIHADQHAIAFHLQHPDLLVVGNDGGVFRSSNAGQTWQALNKGLSITEIEYLAQDPRSADRMLAGTQDNGTLRYEGSPEWVQVAAGDGGDCGIQEEPLYLYFHSFYGMGIERSSNDSERGSWQRIGPDTPTGYKALFYPPLEVQGAVVVQAGESVFISDDTGATWTEITLPDGAGLVSAIAIWEQKMIVVGTELGQILRIDRASGRWKPPVPMVEPRAGEISSILIDLDNADRLWVTYSDAAVPQMGQIFRRDPGSTDWKDVSITGIAARVNVIKADPEDADILYAGADLGVFRSPDGGDRWEDFNHGLPNVIVGDLVFHGPSRRLRAGTRSRGVWEVVLEPKAPT